MHLDGMSRVLKTRSLGHKRPVSSCAFWPTSSARSTTANHVREGLLSVSRKQHKQASKARSVPNESRHSGEEEIGFSFPIFSSATEMSESLQSEATLLLAKVASSGLFTQVFLSSTSSSKSRS